MAIENQTITFDPTEWQRTYGIVGQTGRMAAGQNPVTFDFSGQPAIRYDSSVTPAQAPDLTPAVISSSTNSTAGGTSPERDPSQNDNDHRISVLVSDMIDRKLSDLRFYVLEADITEAQNSVKSIVEMSSF